MAAVHGYESIINQYYFALFYIWQKFYVLRMKEASWVHNPSHSSMNWTLHMLLITDCWSHNITPLHTQELYSCDQHVLESVCDWVAANMARLWKAPACMLSTVHANTQVRQHLFAHFTQTHWYARSKKKDRFWGQPQSGSNCTEWEPCTQGYRSLSRALLFDTKTLKYVVLSMNSKIISRLTATCKQIKDSVTKVIHPCKY